MLDIYSIGDLNYLATILNSIAAWAGTSNPAQFASVGGLIGVFVIAGQSIINGGRAPQFQNFLVAVLFYWFLMGPGVGVTVHDVYSGGTRNVDNVPLGVAVIGSVMSTVGYSITENMEQMFSTPRMSACFSGSSTSGAECGFLSGVRHMGVPAIDMYLPGIYSLPAAQQGDVRKTLGNYIQDCTYTGVVLEQMKMDDILRNTDPWAAVGFNSTIFGTQTYIPGTDPVGGTSRTCLDAHTQIGNYLNGTDFWDHIEPTIKSTMGITGNPYTQLQSELDNMSTETGGVAGTENAYRVYMAKILGTFFGASINAESLLKHNINTGDITLAVAKAQRNEQWRGEKRLFQTTIRPALTFFEGLFYALTPFMAIMVMIVPFGIKMIVRYLQTAVWIQCWMPMMAIVNLFGYMAYYKEFEALSTTSFSASSLYGVVAVQSAANEWVAQADLLGSMVPALAMAVVYGTSVTLTHMAAQLRGGDHYNEKDLKPDAFKVDPLMSYGYFTGAHMTGATGAAPKLEVRDEMSQRIESARSEAETATQTYNSQVRETVGNTSSHQLSSSELTSLGNQVVATGGESAQYVDRIAKAVHKTMTGSEAGSERTAALLAMSGGIGFDSVAGLKGSLQQVYGDQTEERYAEAVQAAHDASGSTTVQAGFQESVMHDHRDQHSSVFAATTSETHDKTMQDTASMAMKAEDAYSLADQQRTSLGVNLSNDIVSMGRKAALEYAAPLAKIAADHGISDDSQAFRSWKERLQTSYGMGNEEAAAGARLMALNDLSGRGNVAAGNALLNTVSAMYGVESGAQLGSPSANAGIGSPATAAGTRAMGDGTKVTGPQKTVNVAEIDNRTAPGTAPTAQPVHVAHNHFQGEATTRGTTMVAGVNGNAADNIIHRMQNWLDDRGMARAGYQELNKRVGFLNNALDGTAAHLEHLENSPILGPQTAALGALRGIREGVEAAGAKFDMAAAAGYGTERGKVLAQEALNLVEQNADAWKKLEDGGALDRVEGAYGAATTGLNMFFNKVSAAAESGQFGEIFSDGFNAAVKPQVEAWSNFQEGVREIGNNLFDKETIQQKAHEEAGRFGLIGEQAELYTEVRTAALTMQHDPGYNPAALSRDSSWDLGNLQEHNWRINAHTNERAMNETVARTIINAAATGDTAPLGMVKGLNRVVDR